MVVSEFDMEDLQKLIIPKVANQRLADLEKYFGRIKPSAIVCLQNLMLRKFAPQVVAWKHKVGAGTRYVCRVCERVNANFCFLCRTGICVTCNTGMGVGYAVCKAAGKTCSFCDDKGDGVCECGAEELQKVMEIMKNQ